MEEVVVQIGSTKLTLTDGTMVREIGEPTYYLDLGVMKNGNRVLFYYDDATEVVDYVQAVIDHLPEFAVKYLEGVLNSESNMLVRCWYVVGSEASCFELYYDADCESNDIMEVISWMGSHNDFANAEFRYTKVCDGHQSCIE